MRLYEEIYQEYAEARCAFLPLSGGYFQGVKSLGAFSGTEILLIFKRARVRVVGERLEIKKYCDGDMEISGRIFSVGVVGAEGANEE